MDNIQQQARNHFEMNIPDTDKPRVVVVGGGFAGIHCIRALRGHGFQIVLFDRHNYHTFQPMLYQVATSGLEPDSISEPMRRIFGDDEDFHFRMLKVTRIHPETREIETLLGTLGYDHLVLACGSKANFFNNSSIAKYAMPLKSVPDAVDLRSQFWQCLEKAGVLKYRSQRAKTLTFVIVGGGPTGVEMAGALAEMRDHVLTKDFPHLNLSLIKICLVHSHEKLLKPMSEKYRQEQRLI